LVPTFGNGCGSTPTKRMLVRQTRHTHTPVSQCPSRGARNLTRVAVKIGSLDWTDLNLNRLTNDSILNWPNRCRLSAWRSLSKWLACTAYLATRAEHAQERAASLHFCMNAGIAKGRPVLRHTDRPHACEARLPSECAGARRTCTNSTWRRDDGSFASDSYGSIRSRELRFVPLTFAVRPTIIRDIYR